MGSLTWKPCTATAYEEMPTARMGHTATLVDARRSWGEELLVVYGGLSTEKQSLGDLAVLQVDSEAWFHPSTISSGPPARVFHCAAAQDGQLYVFGGHAYLTDTKGIHKYNDLWVLNTDNWEWKAINFPVDAARPSARDFPGMVALPGNRLLIFGGLDAATRRLDDSWIFDCTLGTWSELSLPLKPKPRYGFSLAQVDQRVMLFGGETISGLANDVWILKGVVAEGVEQPGWMPLDLPGEGPTPRKAHSLAALGKLVIVCGGHGSEAGWFRTKTTVYHNDIVIMDRSTSVQWRLPKVLGDVPAPREYHTLTAVSPTRALLFGGGDGKILFSGAQWLCLDVEESQQTFQGRSLMDQDLQPMVRALSAQDNALSEMSDLSEHAEQVLLTGNYPTNSAVIPLGTAAARDSVQEKAPNLARGSSKKVWGSHETDLAFEGLKSILGIPAVSVAASALQPSYSTEEEAFQQVGLHAWQSQGGHPADDLNPASPALLQTAARAYLSRSQTKGLRIKELAAMMWDYRQSQALGLQGGFSTAAEVQLAWDGQLADGHYRYCHLQAKDLRIGDVAPLHAQYRSFIGQEASAST